MNSEFNLEAIKARQNKTIAFTDKLGRTFRIRRLKPAEEIRVRGFLGDNDPNDSYANGAITIAASICESGGAPMTFPTNRRDVDMVLNLLDTEGLVAAGDAYVELYPERRAQAEDETAAGGDAGNEAAPSDVLS